MSESLLTQAMPTHDPIEPPSVVEAPAIRLFKPDLSFDTAKTPGGMLARIDALESEVIYLASHLGAVVAHLANNKPSADVPLEPPAPAISTEPTAEMGSVAAALAALTPEQKAALRALLGG